MQKQKHWLTATAAAKILKVTQATVSTMFRNNTIQTQQIGARLYTTKLWIDEYLEKNRRAA